MKEMQIMRKHSFSSPEMQFSRAGLICMQVLVAEIKLINFGAIVTLYEGGSHNGTHKYSEKSRSPKEKRVMNI